MMSPYGVTTVTSPYADTMPRTIISIRDLAAAARGRRQALGLSQADVARRANVSRQWVNEFESGKPAAELALVIRLLDALELSLSIETREAEGGRSPARGTIDLDALLDEHREP
jgi:HTH-type transcriptional regulator/antitoxin HipB